MENTPLTFHTIIYNEVKLFKMAEKKEKVFADGFFFSTRENQPDFVVGRVSIKTEEALAFIKKHTKADGWLNLNILTGRSGKPYMELDTFEPKSTKAKVPVEADDDLPF